MRFRYLVRAYWLPRLRYPVGALLYVLLPTYVLYLLTCLPTFLISYILGGEHFKWTFYEHFNVELNQVARPQSDVRTTVYMQPLTIDFYTFHTSTK